MTTLTHLDDRGEAHMVDVSDKAVTSRTAVAEGFVAMRADTLALIETGAAAKGDVLATARIAGIMAAKRTHELIPLCHPLAVSKVSVDIRPAHAAPTDGDPGAGRASGTGLAVTATVRVSGQTGVEMEALTAVSVACLTIYDMLKAVDRGMTITGVRLIEKSGGRSGTWTADGATR